MPPPGARSASAAAPATRAPGEAPRAPGRDLPRRRRDDALQRLEALAAEELRRLAQAREAPAAPDDPVGGCIDWDLGVAG
ncbi:hypothetical protein LDO32_01480 [Luteimonas sp. Y-2-2-4F]|nr:hypothetical protein [Luteimonas sp. Y-2-2-4F]MCD9030406.1 hypothetical protein [Luteimonas sp. Y-2-2-4F]